MANFGQLKTRVKQMALDADSTEAGLHINDVYKDIVLSCQTNFAKTNYTLNQGDTSFSIADNATEIMYVTYQALGDTLTTLLEPVGFDEILQLNSNQPTGFIRKYAILNDGANISVQLYPGAQSTGDVVSVYGVASPTALVADGDVPTDVHSHYHHLISVGAAARMIQAVGEDETLASVLEQKYDAGIAKYRSYLNKRRSNVPPIIPVGYINKQRQPPHRNDQDIRYRGW